MRALLHTLIPILIIGLGIGAFLGMKSLKDSGIKLNKKNKPSTNSPFRSPNSMRQGPPSIRTRAIPLEKSDHTVTIHTQGEVRTHNASSLTAQVSGRITSITSRFEDGAFFSKGDILLEIDPADHLTELESTKAQLARAEATLAQEKARAKQALLNWKDAGFDETPSDLVLRKPQLREAQASVNSAKSSLKRAQRNLARTKIRAPYDGRVKKRNIGLGQQIGPSTALGEIFSTGIAEVRLPLTIRDLTYYSPPNKPDTTITKNNVAFSSILSDNNKESKKPITWTGTIVRSEGELDKQSRQLFVIARINDPFGLTSDTPALFIGQPVRASIPARILKNVYTIPRDALSGLNEVILIREGKIKRLTITPLWSNPHTIIIRDGIQPGDQLATTRLPYAPEGAPVKIIPPPSSKAKAKAKATPTQISH